MTKFDQFFSIFPKFNDLKILAIGEISGFNCEIQKYCDQKSIQAKFLTTYKKLIDREFEIVIILNIADFKTYKDCYHSLENSGNVIIVLDKAKFELQRIFELLEEIDYRAANNIDIFENFYVVAAKKMHMWGNGY